jgi:hypothetical protein
MASSQRELCYLCAQEWCFCSLFLIENTLRSSTCVSYCNFFSYTIRRSALASYSKLILEFLLSMAHDTYFFSFDSSIAAFRIFFVLNAVLLFAIIRVSLSLHVYSAAGQRSLWPRAWVTLQSCSSFPRCGGL